MNNNTQQTGYKRPYQNNMNGTGGYKDEQYSQYSTQQRQGVGQYG
jgi:hypothetical protein